MPAKRLPWVKLWPELMEREKVRHLSDSQYRTWTYCLLAGSQQPERWRFNSLEHAAYVTRRPMKDVRALADQHFLDSADDGVWIHDAHEYQDVAPSDVARDRLGNGTPGPDDHPPNGRGSVGDRSANGRPTLGEDSANARQNSASRTRGETEKGEIERDIDVPPSGSPPQLRIVGEPAPKPAHPPIDEDFLAAITAEFAPQLGGEPHVRLVIDTALNHRQYTKAIDKRRYLRTWLSRDVEYARGRIASGGGTAYRKPLTDQQLEDLPF